MNHIDFLQGKRVIWLCKCSAGNIYLVNDLYCTLKNKVPLHFLWCFKKWISHCSKVNVTFAERIKIEILHFYCSPGSDLEECCGDSWIGSAVDAKA